MTRLAMARATIACGNYETGVAWCAMQDEELEDWLYDNHRLDGTGVVRHAVAASLLLDGYPTRRWAPVVYVMRRTKPKWVARMEARAARLPKRNP